MGFTLQGSVPLLRSITTAIDTMKAPRLQWDEVPAESPYMTRRQAASHLRCSVETVDRRAIKHAWRYDIDGTRILFYREDVLSVVIAGFRRIVTPRTQPLTING